MNKRWEIYLDRDQYNDFEKFLEAEGFGGFAAASQRNNTVWILCYPSEEIKIIARLRFNIREVSNKYGIDIDITDWQ